MCATVVAVKLDNVVGMERFVQMYISSMRQSQVLYIWLKTVMWQVLIICIKKGLDMYRFNRTGSEEINTF